MSLSLSDLFSITDVALHILPFLGIKELFTLRCVDRKLHYSVEGLLGHLKVLNLLHVTRVPPALITHVLANCYRLREIYLRNFLPIDDDQLQSLLTNNENSLRKIHFSSLHGHNLSAACIQPLLLDRCRRLHTLVISKCNFLTDGSLECFILHLNRNSLEQSKSHNLRSLDLSGSTQISSRVLNLLVKCRCLHLTSLNLSNLLATVQDETIRGISTNSSLSLTLEHLNLVNCLNVTGQGLISLKSCAKLKTLLCRGLNIERVKSAVVTFPPTVFIDIRRQCVVAMETGG